MNGHLYTYWEAQERVECACGWKKKAKGRAMAMRQHLAHILKNGMDAIIGLPKTTRAPFTFDGGTL